MAVARFNLFIQSYILLLKTQQVVLYRRFEILAAIGYWVWYLTFLSYLPSTSAKVLYFFISNCAVGILHVQIVLSHFTMPVYTGVKYETGTDDDCFVKTQLETSMDVDCPEWFDW